MGKERDKYEESERQIWGKRETNMGKRETNMGKEANRFRDGETDRYGTESDRQIWNKERQTDMGQKEREREIWREIDTEGRDVKIDRGKRRRDIQKRGDGERDRQREETER